MCVVGSSGGWIYRTTAGGRGLASGMPSPERLRRPKTFSRFWSPICNEKAAYKGQEKGNANEGGSVSVCVCVWVEADGDIYKLHEEIIKKKN